MAVEYDLVVIGATVEGYEAAIAAAQHHARVALVSQKEDLQPAQVAQAWRQTQQWLYTRQSLTSQSFAMPVLAGGQLQPWMEALLTTLQDRQAPSRLALLGIDWIDGQGQFKPHPPLAFQVEQRQLRSRAYLIAVGSEWQSPTLSGLAATDYLTPADLLPPQQFPPRLIVLGGGPQGVELSQQLIRQGCQVSLVTRHPQLLVLEDRDVAFWVQAQLEAEGVEVLTGETGVQAEITPSHKRLKLSAGWLEAEELVITVGRRPRLASLNLELVGVQHSEQRISVNSYLQTTNPQIYACGAALGGYALLWVARYEAQIALKNALFFPSRQVNYATVPWTIQTDPPLARVGLTEAQAQQQYGNQSQILKQFDDTNLQAQLQGTSLGGSKLIAHANGRLLGAHLWGPGAEETIPMLALALQQRLSLRDLVHLTPWVPCLGNLISQATPERQSKQRDGLESWFRFLRSWCP